MATPDQMCVASIKTGTSLLSICNQSHDHIHSCTVSAAAADVTTFNFCLTCQFFRNYSILGQAIPLETVGAGLFTGQMPFLLPNQHHQSTKKQANRSSYSLWLF